MDAEMLFWCSCSVLGILAGGVRLPSVFATEWYLTKGVFCSCPWGSDSCLPCRCAPPLWHCASAYLHTSLLCSFPLLACFLGPELHPAHVAFTVVDTELELSGHSAAPKWYSLTEKLSSSRDETAVLRDLQMSVCTVSALYMWWSLRR